MGKGYIVVEGQGEVEAAGNLIARMSLENKLGMYWAQPLRFKNLHQKSGVERAANYIRTKADAEALLVLRDEDDLCPRERGPEIAGWIRDLQLPFPTAVALLHPEYEVLFLPCVEQMAGQKLGERGGLTPGTRWEGDWESRRGVKEWLTEHMPRNRSYKPTLDQLPLTRMIDLPTLRNAGVPCFGTLERALAFLATRQDPGCVYPAPAPTGR